MSWQKNYFAVKKYDVHLGESGEYFFDYIEIKYLMAFEENFFM